MSKNLLESKQTHNISIRESYNGKQILLTGATGFLGKVILAKILYDLPSIGCIYVLIRDSKKGTAVERFIQEIAASPAMRPLREKHQDNFNQFLADRIKVIVGNVIESDLGLSPSVSRELFSKLNLIINVAGLVDFFPDVRRAIEANVFSTLNMANFAAQCKQTKLLHISSCYVAGAREGIIKEMIEIDRAPNGLNFDAEKELQIISNLIDNRTSEIKSTRRYFIELGRERSSYWGWCNTYVYSKAIAEILLKKHYSHLDITIVRPSIIESAIQFPFPGWNEGLNTTAPLCYLGQSWYPFTIGKKSIIIDSIPVDLVTNAIITIAAAQLNGQAQPVYQLATSVTNPCTLKLLKDSARNWFRIYLRKNSPNWVTKYLKTLMPVKFIPPNHICSPKQLAIFLNKMMNFFGAHKLKHQLSKIARSLQEIDKMYTVYLPFIFDNHYQFMAEAIQYLSPIEKEFLYEPAKINWKEYLMNIHMPGLNQWIYESNKALQTSPVVFTNQEKELIGYSVNPL